MKKFPKFPNLLLLSFFLLGLCSAFAHAEQTTAVIQLKERIPMQSLVQAMQNPISPHFQKAYTPDEIRDLVGPTPEQLQAVEARLSAEQIQVTHLSHSRLFLTVRGERAALAHFRQSTHALLDSAVVTVHGLDPSAKRRPHLRLQATPTDDAGIQPAQIQHAYGFDQIYAAGGSARGQHIAIATYDGFNLQDVRDYYKLNHITPAPKVDQIAFNGTAVYNMDSAAETQTDIEFSGMIAHGASIHVFASAENSDVGELAMFTAIVDDNRSKVVNYSWGTCESQTAADHQAAMDKIFLQAVAQGINVFVASGDSGSDCQQDGTTVADFPASNPSVIAVGGTTLALTADGLASETAWNGSGGGVSKLYARPAYQSGLDTKLYPMRAYPDVSFNADPASGQPTYIHYTDAAGNATKDATYVVIGGTSIAAPQWAGFTALLGAARGSKVLDLHSLYGLSTAEKTKVLNDVVSGSNGAFTAAPGWDAVTGWGSMKADALLKALK